MHLGSGMTVHRFRMLLALSALAAWAPVSAQQIRRTLPGSRDSASAPRVPTIVEPGPVGVIDGLVTDTTLAPLRGAYVSVMRTPLSVATGPNGRFRITNIPVGQYIVIVKRAGFHATSQVLEVTAKDTLRLSYTLGLLNPNELAPIVITEKASGPLSPRMKEFEARRKRGEGEFMTEDQINKHNPGFPTELLRLFSSISVQPTSGGGGEYIYYPVSARATGGMTSTGQATCFMTVFVDNVPMPAPFNLDLLPSPRQMAGIEVYAGAATMPVQYASLNHGCGVILVWTKDGFNNGKK
jgi:hypothetical protein